MSINSSQWKERGEFNFSGHIHIKDRFFLITLLKKQYSINFVLCILEVILRKSSEAEPFWFEIRFDRQMGVYTWSKCCHADIKSHMLLPLLKVHLIINPKVTQLLTFLSCFQNLFFLSQYGLQSPNQHKSAVILI